MPALPPVQPSPQRRARRFPKLQVALLLLALAAVSAFRMMAHADNPQSERHSSPPVIDKSDP